AGSRCGRDRAGRHSRAECRGRESRAAPEPPLSLVSWKNHLNTFRVWTTPEDIGAVEKRGHAAAMRFLARRFAHALLVLAGVSILSFVFTAAAPGEPFSDLALDPRVSASTAAALRDRYGVGRPLPVRYARWLRSVARGELGYSLGYDRPVA